MRKPNIKCTKCHKPLYRRPQELVKWPNPLCKNCRENKRSEYSFKDQERRLQEYIKKWKSGLVSGMKGKTSTSGYIRRYLFRRAKQKCEHCKWSKVNSTTGKIPLEINHKDGNFQNNKEENLELLCPNCHSLTDSYRSLNKGKGRPR